MRICCCLILAFLFLSANTSAQTDSLTFLIKKVPTRYFTKVDGKINKYTKRISGKTEKTLVKLSRWESKIKSLLTKVSPNTAGLLFGPGVPTFSSALKKYKDGQAIAGNYITQYDAYRDNLTTGLKFFAVHTKEFDSNLRQKVIATALKSDNLNSVVAESESIEKFIKDRKKLLIDLSIKHINTNKYLEKINKESFYYVATLRNYKEIFSDKKKAEETALGILNKAPAFEKFFRSNSMLASIFRSPNNYGAPEALGGLQTRTSINAFIQGRISAAGPNANEIVAQNLQAAQAELNKLKDKILKAGGSNVNADMPDFKPNLQKTKTFRQRLVFGSNLQFTKAQSVMPANANIGLQGGYKVNDKSIIGVGASYKLGLGKIEEIGFSHQGIGLRSFLDWEIKKQFFVSGGYEMNRSEPFKTIQGSQYINPWQSSCLLGIGKKVKSKNKFMKGAQVQLFYDFLYKQHTPITQPLVYRLGYTF